MTSSSLADRRAAFKSRLLDPSQPAMALPGAFNAAVGRLIQQVGFEAVYVSGAGLHNGVAGIPDEGGLSLDEMAQFSGYIARAVTVPVIADADTGFGEIARCVEAYEHNGLCGLHLEDQVFPKRCGHLDGKQVISTEEMQGRIHEAVSARKDPNFLIIARVDSRSVKGYADAVGRAKAYMEAGADLIFAEAMQSREEFAQFVIDTQAPLLANMTEFGKSPYMSFDEFSAMGYRMVIYPMTTFRLAMKAIETGLLELKQTGTQEGLLDSMQTRKELYALLDYSPSGMTSPFTAVTC